MTTTTAVLLAILATSFVLLSIFFGGILLYAIFRLNQKIDSQVQEQDEYYLPPYYYGNDNLLSRVLGVVEIT